MEGQAIFYKFLLLVIIQTGGINQLIPALNPIYFTIQLLNLHHKQSKLIQTPINHIQYLDE